LLLIAEQVGKYVYNVDNLTPVRTKLVETTGRPLNLQIISTSSST